HQSLALTRADGRFTASDGRIVLSGSTVITARDDEGYTVASDCHRGARGAVIAYSAVRGSSSRC
ncbi:MAG: hypothetical protein V5A45_15860, partial [Haloarculaceae archaeon]